MKRKQPQKVGDAAPYLKQAIKEDKTRQEAVEFTQAQLFPAKTPTIHKLGWIVLSIFLISLIIIGTWWILQNFSVTSSETVGPTYTDDSPVETVTPEVTSEQADVPDSTSQGENNDNTADLSPAKLAVHANTNSEFIGTSHLVTIIFTITNTGGIAATDGVLTLDFPDDIIGEEDNSSSLG